MVREKEREREREIYIYIYSLYSDVVVACRASLLHMLHVA